MGVGKYTGELVRWLEARGHTLRVVCAPPYYPQWKVQDPYRSWAYRLEREGRLTVMRCPVWVPRRLGPLRRILHLLSFGLSASIALLLNARFRPDWVLVVAPTLTSVPGALLYAMARRASTWLHVQDFELGAAVGLGMARERKLWKGLGWLERFLMRRFDRVSSISHGMTRRLQQGMPTSDRVVMFPNWIDCDLIRPDLSGQRIREQLGVGSDEVVALYSGTLNSKQHLEVVIDAARSLQAFTQLRFVICGDGPDKALLRSYAGRLPNLTWMGPQPSSEFRELLCAADIHLLPQREGAAQHVMPSKLGGMLASGRPVVATAREGSDVAEIVHACGVVTPPGDSLQFAEGVKRLALQSELRQRLGSRARQFALENLEKHIVLSSFETLLEPGCRQQSKVMQV